MSLDSINHLIRPHREWEVGTVVQILAPGLIRSTYRVKFPDGSSGTVACSSIARIAPMSNVTELSRPGKISGDRVHFTVPARQLLKKSYIQLLEDCFGIRQGEYDNHQDLEVVCRPSQFARFIILRHTKHKESNEMSALNMRLVSPAPLKRENKIDCSTRANTAYGEVAA